MLLKFIKGFLPLNSKDSFQFKLKKKNCIYLTQIFVKIMLRDFKIMTIMLSFQIFVLVKRLAIQTSFIRPKGDIIIDVRATLKLTEALFIARRELNRVTLVIQFSRMYLCRGLPPRRI